MKRKTTALLLSLSLLCSSAYTVMANDDIKVTIDGRQIAFDVPPQLINDRTMVPLRAIFEALNATVDWNDETQTVTSTKDDTTIQLTINNPTMYVNGSPITLDSPACLINDRTLVPVRAISEAFKTNVDWDNDTKTVIISANGSVTPQVSYDDISANVNQINSMITNGQYLEAITECEQTWAWHTLSDDDKNILANLKNTAQTKYNEYEASVSYAETTEKVLLTRNEIEVKVKPDASSLIFENKSQYPYTFNCVSINGTVVLDFDLGKSVTINPGETKLVNCRYVQKKKDLGTGSYGYVVVYWQGEQYYMDFTVNGITTFYKGNARGPAN